MDRIGRFSIAGRAAGEPGPDLSVLPRLHAAMQSGTRLGTPWSGTVVWCEGSDVKLRYGRLGANIAGLAVHEGYWVDVDALRSGHADWLELQRSRLGTEEQVREARGVLAQGGIARSFAPLLGALGEERAIPPLGAARRLKLAVLLERLEASGASVANPELPLVAFDEVLAVTEVHEQGHLCDRARLLPVFSNLGAVWKLLSRSGFTPRGVSERLEYRAQLVALCEVDDPRLALAECLEAAESGGSGVTTHGGAYVELLGDLLERLRERVDADPDFAPALDRGAYLIHQLHQFEAEELRATARELARSEGLVGALDG